MNGKKKTFTFNFLDISFQNYCYLNFPIYSKGQKLPLHDIQLLSKD